MKTPCPLPNPARKTTVQLRILATTDLHASLAPYDYDTDAPHDNPCLAALAGVIEQARAETENCILLDNGDLLQGTATGFMFAQQVREQNNSSTPHPIISAMNTLQYDAAGLGNHDFDYGTEVLCKAVEHANFPIILTNAIQAAETKLGLPRPLFSTSEILTREVVDETGKRFKLRIGVIGLLPPEVMMGLQHRTNSWLELQDCMHATRETAGKLRAEGADIIAVLAHTGIGANRPQENSNSLANQLIGSPEIDAVILGHSHEVFAQSGSQLGRVAIQAGHSGSHLGLIDLHLHGTEGAWNLVSAQANVRPSSTAFRPEEVKPSKAFAAQFATAHRATAALMRQVVGQTTRPLHSYFSRITSALPERLIGQVLRDHTTRRLSDINADGVPVLAAVPPTKCGGPDGSDHFCDVPPGPVSLRHVLQLYPYPNRFAAVHLTGDDLRTWLERSAQTFLTVRRGQTRQTLLNPATPGYLCDSLEGLTYAIDISRPVGERISSIQHAGKPVLPDDVFIVAMSDFRAFGGGGYLGSDRNIVIFEPETDVFSLLQSHIAEFGSNRIPDQPTWRFSPLPDTSAVFETGKHARNYARLDCLPELNDLGDSSNGFARFELML